MNGEIVATSYIDPKDGWRLRWPFVRSHLRGSLESLQALARGGAATAGFIRPAIHESDILQLPLRLRFTCDRVMKPSALAPKSQPKCSAGTPKCSMKTNGAAAR